MAQKREDFQFVLIGVDYDQKSGEKSHIETTKCSLAGLKGFTNNYFRYVWQFDVAVIPFKINDITLMTSPIKLFEYFACHKPVVSTPLPECKQYEEVFCC